MTIKAPKRSKLIGLFFLGLFSLLAITSCHRGETYYQFQELKDGDWAVEQVLVFELDSADIKIGVPYNLSVEITNNVDYPYQNLWLFSEYCVGDSTVSERKDELFLADQYGQWVGAGFGSLYQSSFLTQTIQFDQLQNNTLYIRHGMTDKVLHGIEKIGIKITESE